MRDDRGFEGNHRAIGFQGLGNLRQQYKRELRSRTPPHVLPSNM